MAVFFRLQKIFAFFLFSLLQTVFSELNYPHRSASPQRQAESKAPLFKHQALARLGSKLRG